MAWVPPGMCDKQIGRSTLRKHHDFVETFTFGKTANGNISLPEVWMSESRTTVSQSQNKDIERFWTDASTNGKLLKETRNTDEAVANRLLFSSAKSRSALRMDDEERPKNSHYKANFGTGEIEKPPSHYSSAVDQAKQNKALGKQSSVCLAYY